MQPQVRTFKPVDFVSLCLSFLTTAHRPRSDPLYYPLTIKIFCSGPPLIQTIYDMSTLLRSRIWLLKQTRSSRKKSQKTFPFRFRTRHNRATSYFFPAARHHWNPKPFTHWKNIHSFRRLRRLLGIVYLQSYILPLRTPTSIPIRLIYHVKNPGCKRLSES